MAWMASQIDLGVQAGYQLTVGKAAQAQVCPVGSLSLGMGPNDIGGTGVDASGMSGTLGLAVGKVMGCEPEHEDRPQLASGLAYRKQKLDDGTNPALGASETYGLASVGVGLIFNSNIAVRPSVSIPLGSDLSNDPTFGLTVAYNFGSKSAPSRKR